MKKYSGAGDEQTRFPSDFGKKDVAWLSQLLSLAEIGAH